MLEQLFGSKTRLKVLRILYREPDKAFFVRELGRSVGVQINAVRRELELLSAIGLVREIEKEISDPAESGATLRKYYQLDRSCIIYEELRALLLKEQIMGEQEFIEEIKNKTGQVLLLVLTGQFMQAAEAPTDLLVVGELKARSLSKIIDEYEKAFGFPIRYTTMTEREFGERRYVMDKFLFAIFEAKHIKAVNYLGV